MASPIATRYDVIQATVAVCATIAFCTWIATKAIDGALYECVDDEESSGFVQVGEGSLPRHSS